MLILVKATVQQPNPDGGRSRYHDVTPDSRREAHRQASR